MPETIIRECATPDCANTWEVWDEDDQRKICGLCEIEGVAQTQAPTAESEGFRSIEKRISMAMTPSWRTWRNGPGTAVLQSDPGAPADPPE